MRPVARHVAGPPARSSAARRARLIGAWRDCGRCRGRWRKAPGRSPSGEALAHEGAAAIALEVTRPGFHVAGPHAVLLRRLSGARLPPNLVRGRLSAAAPGGGGGAL